MSGGSPASGRWPLRCQGKVRRLAGVAIAALALLLAGCARQEGDAPGGPPAGVGGQRAQLDALRDEVGRAPARPPACNVDDPQAFVRMAEFAGDNCIGHRLQIGGHECGSVTIGRA